MTATHDKEWTDLELAKLFHSCYEKNAVNFNWETNPDCKKKHWSELPENNKKTMIATCADIRNIVFAQLRRDAYAEGQKNGMTPLSQVFVNNAIHEAKKELLDSVAKQDLALYETIRLYYNLKVGHGLTLSLFKQKVLELINNQKELRAKTLGEKVK